MIGTDDYPGMLFPLAQADNALRLSGLTDDDLFRVELRQAIAAFAELIAAARSLKVRPDGRGYFESGQDCQRFRAALAAVTAQSTGSVTGEDKG